MKKTFLLSIILLIVGVIGKAQVGIGTNIPSATLDIVSNDNTPTTKSLEINNNSAVEMITITSNGQVGINASTPETNALLELKSTNKALLITRVTNTATIASPVNGMILYDNSSNCIKAFENNAWSGCLSN